MSNWRLFKWPEKWAIAFIASFLLPPLSLWHLSAFPKTSSHSELRSLLGILLCCMDEQVKPVHYYKCSENMDKKTWKNLWYKIPAGCGVVLGGKWCSELNAYSNSTSLKADYFTVKHIIFQRWASWVQNQDLSPVWVNQWTCLFLFPCLQDDILAQMIFRLSWEVFGV